MKNRGKLDDTLAAMFSNITYANSYLFYAHLIGQCSIVIDNDMECSAAVSFKYDHYNLYINPLQFDKYPLVQRLGILKHEMLHILYGHVQRTEDRVHFPWNIATDCSLNQHIEKEHLPDGSIFPETFTEWGINAKHNESAEYYYELLKNEAKEMKENGELDSKVNSHDKWLESEGDPDLQKDLTKKMIEKSQESTIKSKGTVPNSCSIWLSLHSRKSEVNWRKVLRGIVGNKRVGKRPTIMKSNRRFPLREDLKGTVKDRVFNLLVIADVSGSMSDQAVISTLAEVKHICDVTKTDVDLIQVDTEAYTPEKLTKKTKLITRKGSGGTTLYPAIELANKHKIDYQAVVILTDGGLFGNDIENFSLLRKKVIWLVESGGTILPEMNSGKMKSFKLEGN